MLFRSLIICLIHFLVFVGKNNVGHFKSVREIFQSADVFTVRLLLIAFRIGVVSLFKYYVEFDRRPSLVLFSYFIYESNFQ